MHFINGKVLCMGDRMRELEYPFDCRYIRRKKKAIKRQLLENEGFIDKKIAILGGSTTSEVKDILELFLLNYGIRPVFYESEYNQFWQDVMFENAELVKFCPDVIFIHTSNRNITTYPEITNLKEDIEHLLNEQYEHFRVMWDKISQEYRCPIIQNNFEYPYFRLLGNKDVGDIHGRTNFVARMNILFSEYAQEHDGFFINDINYQSAVYGLEKWSNPMEWHMYKYALCLDAIPILAFNVANIIKSIYGKNKKALAIDLDNTLWGGIVGDDGVENLEIGMETPMGQAYTEFQYYLKQLKKQGVLLNIISKNELENALAGMHHPQMLLKTDDFISIKANWEPKSVNLVNIAEELTLLPDSFVFVDDNPAEREIIRQQVPGTGIPEMQKVEHYIKSIDQAGYFEVTNISKDDLERSVMYKENVARASQQSKFENYQDYLLSLNMKAEIREFQTIYISRIAQLTNKSNQFNLTTRRYTQEEIEEIAVDNGYITLYGKLEDCFGDNGVVSVVIGKIEDSKLNILLWLMSCRVLKRDMEFAMMDELVRQAGKREIYDIYGYYYPTQKNAMVKDFYAVQGFSLIEEDEAGNRIWHLNTKNGYINKNHVINVCSGDKNE